MATPLPILDLALEWGAAGARHKERVRRQLSQAQREPRPQVYESHHVASILVAEDDVEMRILLGEVLRGAGYTVYELRDGRELLRFVERGLVGDERVEVDVVISDIRMPGPDGLRVLQRLRGDDWATPVILITAFGTRSTHEEARRLGAATLLDKPFEIDDLLTAVSLIVPPRF